MIIQLGILSPQLAEERSEGKPQLRVGHQSILLRVESLEIQIDVFIGHLVLQLHPVESVFKHLGGDEARLLRVIEIENLPVEALGVVVCVLDEVGLGCLQLPL